MNFPPIVFGAGAFNTQYNKDPELKDIASVIKHAIDSGVTAIDTAAYYGPSEVLVGQALKKIGYPRESYLLCSKCCRWETNEFDFSKESVNKSVNRSLQRLNTSYLDCLYIHDVEFTTPEEALTAVQAAFELKDAGKIRNVGISGYPLDVILKTAKLVKSKLGRSLDAVLSYCNLTLQNDLLLEFTPELEKLGVKTILNASPLSMSLLRQQPTHDFHPASSELKARADEIGQKQGSEYANVALQYAFAKWQPRPTVLGMRTKEEIDSAVSNFKIASSNPDESKWQAIVNEFGDLHNTLWEEPRPKEYAHHWDAI